MSKKTLREKLEEFKKAMRNGGLGGPGSVKAGAVLPNITGKQPKPGNNSLAGKMGMPNPTPKSKKDSIKSIEQTQNKDIKDLKMKEAQAALKAKAPEVIKFEDNGQWRIEKSNYGPKDMKLYNPVDNTNRKQTRTSEIREVGPNKAVRQYTTSGSSTDKARVSSELKRQREANKKAPVKTLKDLDPETVKQIRDRYETKGKS